MEQNNQKIEEYCTLLKLHDFYYAKSDDHRRYEEGLAQEKQILKMRKEIDDEFNGLGTLIYNLASPFKI